MAGLYGGTMTVGELLEHGDLGLGTLDSIDGELIVLDGKAYQAKGSGEQPEIVEVSPDALIPYAAVVPHQAEVIFRQRFEMTDKELAPAAAFTGTLYSAAALFKAFARRPLVPPPAQRTRTFVSSVMVFVLLLHPLSQE